MPKPHHKTLAHRLLPLYIGAFFQGFVLWYAVEKLFMTTIGFNAATIGIMSAAYSFMMLIIETPSGILADRWSRKGVLILASIALAICSIICGLSTNIITIFWGIFFAFYSGSYDAIIYDTLLEETGHSNGFEKYFGRVRIFDSTALVVSSLLGGLIGSTINLQTSFLATIPFALVSIIALAAFREPKLHKAVMAEPIVEHIKSTFAAVAQHGSLIGILIILVLGATVTETIMDFDQLWLMASSTPIALFGPTSALILATLGLAGFIAPHIDLNKRKIIVIITTILVLSSIILVTINSPWPLIGAMTAICGTMLSISIIYTRRLHDRVPSQIRSGAASAVSSMGRTLLVFTSLAFGWLSQQFSVSLASWIILVPLVFISLFLFMSQKSGITSANHH